MKYTLITGASSGIGEAFARRLAAEKHNLVLVARSGEKLKELCDELTAKHQISCRYFAIDLLEFEADVQLFDETEKNGLEIDWLINNAGFGSSGDFANLDLEKELEIIDLNVSALVALTHRYLQKMRERKAGTIINVSSAAGFQPIPFMATYAASKAFVSSFTEAIAEENRPFGVRILALCPGSTKTNFFAASNIERPIQVKGQQTVEDVVDTAMKAISGSKAKVVSGWANYIGALAGTLVPNSISSRVMAKALRSRHQKTEV
ncbi:MAG TPA: SDR family oxidoreductase [Pyrinomonadaceae bacterium]|nr:SDR family oxidoreductase [Pyrinomonadaceae bacterium]